MVPTGIPLYCHCTLCLNDQQLLPGRQLLWVWIYVTGTEHPNGHIMWMSPTPSNLTYSKPNSSSLSPIPCLPLHLFVLRPQTTLQHYYPPRIRILGPTINTSLPTSHLQWPINDHLSLILNVKHISLQPCSPTLLPPFWEAHHHLSHLDKAQPPDRCPAPSPPPLGVLAL